MAKLWYGFLYAYKRIYFKITDIGGLNKSRPINPTTIMVIILEMKIIDKSK